MHFIRPETRQVLWHEVDFRSDVSLTNFAEAAWEHRSAEQRRVELMGEMCAAWYEGLQYLAAMKVGERYFQLQPVPNLSGRLRLIFNLFSPHLDQLIAKLGLDALDPEAVPQTASIPDLDATRLQTAVLQYYKEALDLQARKDEQIEQLVMEGMTFTKVTWDPLAGTEFILQRDDAQRFDVEPEAQRRLFGGDEAQQARLNSGEVRVDNVSLRNLTWGPVGVPWHRAEYVIEACERTFSDARDRWNLRDNEIEAAYEQSKTRWYRGYFEAGGSIMEDNRRDRLLSYEVWAPRSKRRPNGTHAVIIGGKVVNRPNNKDVRNPYEHGRIPYVACKMRRVPKRLVAISPAFDAFEPQAMLNKLASQVMENNELMANPRLWVQQDEPIDTYELTSEPGGVHRYKNEIPTMMDGKTVPNSVYAAWDRWIMVLQQAIGIQDASIGRPPKSGRSGRFVIALQDANDTRMGPALKRITRTWENVGGLLLAVVEQFVRDGRLIASQGADMAWRRRAFHGRQLRASDVPSSGPQRYNVRIRTSGQARSRAAQIELVTMLIQFGFYRPDNPEDRRQVMRILELGEGGRQLDTEQQHRDMQRRVHETLLAGRFVAPEMWQPHDVRISELHRFMNSPEFEGQPPQVRQLFVQYEEESIRLQAGREVWERQLVAEGYQRAERQLMQRRISQSFGDIQATAPSGETQRLARMFNGPQGSRLRQFFDQGVQAA